jgi:succinylarginine dihydrolase
MVTEPVKEVIFVGLPGPTHNYGGLSKDNVASSLNRGNTSNPKQAALQALGLVRLMKSLGVEVGILPPQLRPHLASLRQRFHGDAEQLIAQAAKQDPALLEKLCSSSAMWTANAATTSPAIDNADQMLHLTVANLHTNLHRRIEADDTYRVLNAIFAQVPGARVHPPLDAAQGFRDEGAANHMRLLPRHNGRGLHVFVYGADGSQDDPKSARQTLSAFQAIKTEHGIPATHALFIKQNPAVIREGVFHNDVIAVSNESVLLVHEQAYAGGRLDIERIADMYKSLHGEELNVIMITDADLEVDEAVHTYFFNSQIITKPDGRMAVIAPSEVEMLYAGKAARLFKTIKNDSGNPIDEVHFVDLRQSMNNGGGPACLRLRVPMVETRVAAIKTHVNVMADDALLKNIESIIETHYPDKVDPEDIADPALYFGCRTVLMELGALMNLPLLD